MPIEVTALAKKLGLPETAFESESTFEQAFNDPKTGYVPRARAHEDESIAKHFNDAIGKRLGQLEALTRRVFKEEFEVEELEPGAVEAMFIDGAKKVKSKLHKIKEDAAKGVDTRISELTTTAAELKVKLESEKERAETANKMLKEKETEFEGFKTNLKLDGIVTEAWKQVELIPDMTEIQRRGLMDMIRESYEFKVGDGTGEVWDRKANKPAMNEAGNVPMKIPDAIKTVAEKNQLLRKNNLNRGNTQPYIPSQTNGTEERVSRTQQTLAKNPRINS